MKTVANFNSLEEAQILKLELGSCGIESFIPDEMSAGVAPHIFLTKAGIRVQVADEDEEDARQVIADRKTGPSASNSNDR
jgi:hypothetical protein